VKSRQFRGTAFLAAILGALILIDMWPVDKRYMNDSMFSKGNTFEQAFKMQPWEKQILDSDKDPNFRVLNLAANTFNDARTSYRLKSIGGYSAAKLRRYQDLIDQHLSKMHWPVLNMLNAKYIIFQDQESGQTLAQRNPDAMGNAWFVDQVHYVSNANEELDCMAEIDLRHEAIADDTFKEQIGDAVHQDGESLATLTDYKPNCLTYKLNSDKGGVVVFSEIYYPGWTATIDGEQAKLGRVDYVLRALNVPAGEHEVVLTFKPSSIRTTETVAYVSYFVLLLAVALGLFFEWKRRKN
jgi:uncharacterized membrane protein YfhO